METYLGPPVGGPLIAMHIYFYGPSDKKDLRPVYAVVKEALERAPIYLSTNTGGPEVQVSPDILADAQQSHVPLLERMDAFIIEGTHSDPEIGFLLAHAIALKKPTLYLYRRGTVPSIFQHLSQRELPPFIRVTSYSETNMTRALDEFLERLDGIQIKAVPRIKFTLRITKVIEAYLHFKTHNTKLSKADFLREAIERMMDADEGWKTYDHHRRHNDTSS